MDSLKYDLSKAMPILRSFGVAPENLTPEKLSRLCALAETISNPESITAEKSREILDIMGVSVRPKPKPKKRPVKIGRNDPCPCQSGKKYKKCCGKNVN